MPPVSFCALATTTLFYFLICSHTFLFIGWTPWMPVPTNIALGTLLALPIIQVKKGGLDIKDAVS